MPAAATLHASNLRCSNSVVLLPFQCLHTLGDENTHGPTDGVTSVSISPDGRTIAAVASQPPTSPAPQRGACKTFVTASGVSGTVQGSLDKVVRLWDTATGHFLGKLGDPGHGGAEEGHTDSVYSVAFSPDGPSTLPPPPPPSCSVSF